MTSLVPYGRQGRPLVWLLPLLFAALAVGLFLSIGTDDSYITYWAAHTLGSRGEIVNYNGARVEQSSSMLHVLVLAILAKLIPLSLPMLSAVLGIACGALTVLLTIRLADRIDASVSSVAGLLVALSIPLLHWSVGGLETTLTSTVVALMLLSIAPSPARSSPSRAGKGTVVICVVVTAYLLVRPEAFAVLVSMLIGVLTVLLARRRISGDVGPQDELTRAQRALIIALVGFCAIVTFRILYFGSPFPQPVLAKAGGVSLQQGIAYFRANAFTKYDGVIWVLALAGIGRVLFRAATGRSYSPTAMLVGLFTVAQSAFVVASGGDWMARGRFLVSMLPLVVVSGLVFVRELRPRLFVPVAAVLVSLQVWPLANIVRFDSHPAIWTLVGRERPDPAVPWLEYMNGEHSRDLPAIAALRDIVDQLRGAEKTPVSIFTGQMGMVPYYLAMSHGGAIRFIDRFALTTTDFMSCPVTSKLPRDSFGLRLDYGFFMRNRSALRDVCGLGDPDLLFDLSFVLSRIDGDPNDPLTVNGYSMIYRDAGRFIAVRHGLAGFVTREYTK